MNNNRSTSKGIYDSNHGTHGGMPVDKLINQLNILRSSRFLFAPHLNHLGVFRVCRFKTQLNSYGLLIRQSGDISIEIIDKGKLTINFGTMKINWDLPPRFSDQREALIKDISDSLTPANIAKLKPIQLQYYSKNFTWSAVRAHEIDLKNSIIPSQLPW